MPTAKTSYESYWNKFAAFCDKNNASNPSVVTEEAPSHVDYFIIKRFDGNNAAGAFYNIRSAIRSNFKRTTQTSHGWRKWNVLNTFCGNPCDTIEVTNLTKGTHNNSCNRGDTAKRAMSMTMSVVCQLW